MSEFWEAYKDPRWQRKRLEIMQRAGFECERCGSSDKTLNVHHAFYKKDAKPWEYDDDQLHCWCEDCHAIFHIQKEAFCIIASRLESDAVAQAIGYLGAAWRAANGQSVFLVNEDIARGWADFWGIRSWKQFVGKSVSDREAEVQRRAELPDDPMRNKGLYLDWLMRQPMRESFSDAAFAFNC